MSVLFPVSRHVLAGTATELVRIRYTDAYGVENDPYSLTQLGLVRLYVPDGSLLAPWAELGAGPVVTRSFGLELHAGAGLRIAPIQWFFVGPTLMLHAQTIAQTCDANGESTATARCRPSNDGYFSAELVLGVELPH